MQQHYRVEWSLDKQFPLPDKARLISPTSFTGCWDIQPNEDHGLNAVYWIQLEPGGLLPDWLVRAAIRRYLADLMAALHEHLLSTSTHDR